MYLKRLRELREDHDYTQTYIAKKLMITQQQYQLYESGKRSIGTEHLISLCRLYGVSADYILELRDD